MDALNAAIRIVNLLQEQRTTGELINQCHDIVRAAIIADRERRSLEPSEN